MRPGYFILYYSTDGGNTWNETGPMLWKSMQSRQRKLRNSNPQALSAPKLAFR